MNGNQREELVISESDLARLKLSTREVNTAQTVTFALPQFALEDPNANAVVLMIAPLLAIPRQTVQELLNNQHGTTIGVLKAVRDLPWSNQRIPHLPAGMYLVKVKSQDQMLQMVFVDGHSVEYAYRPNADLRRMNRDVNPPEAIITIEDIAYSWGHIQVASEPSPRNALTQYEWDEMSQKMQSTIKELKLNPEDFNISGTTPALEGNIAVRLRRASLLATVPLRPPSTDGTLLGVIHVLHDVDFIGRIVMKGKYIVRRDPDNNKSVVLQGLDPRTTFSIPAAFVEVRGQRIGGEREAPIVSLRCFCLGDCCVFCAGFLIGG